MFVSLRYLVGSCDCAMLEYRWSVTRGLGHGSSRFLLWLFFWFCLVLSFFIGFLGSPGYADSLISLIVLCRLPPEDVINKLCLCLNLYIYVDYLPPEDFHTHTHTHNVG